MEAYERAQKDHGRYFCRRCIDQGPDGVSVIVAAEERFSMGVFAGTLCDECWKNDSRNHDRDFDPMDAGEAYEPDDY